MSVLNFNSDTPMIYYDESLKLHLTLTASWEVEADTKDEYANNTIKFFVSNTLTDMLREYQRTVPFKELSGKSDEISFTISEKLTAKMQFPCRARLTALTPDDRSAEILRLTAEKERLSDPAVMAAEMEKAMQKARETAEKNGMNLDEIMNRPLPEMPEMPELPDDPLERAKAITEYSKKLTQTASAPAPAPAAPAKPAAPDWSSMTPEEKRKAIVGGMVSDDRAYKPNDPKPAMMGMGVPAGNMQTYRPKFCMSCGSKLPPTGNFCGNCGKSIM